MTRKAPITIDMQDCQMDFIASGGVRVCILDTFCKEFTPEKKRIVDAEIIRIYNQIKIRCISAADKGVMDGTRPFASITLS